MNKQITISNIKFLVLGVMVSLGLNLVYAWTVPNNTPPLDNVTAPISYKGGYQTAFSDYPYSTSCQVANSFTGGCSCPSGSVSHLISKHNYETVFHYGDAQTVDVHNNFMMYSCY